METFASYEIIGRDIFLKYTNSNDEIKIHKFSIDEFANYDVSYFSAGTMVIGEIKFREIPSTEYDNSYLQQHKYRALQRLKRLTDIKYRNQNKRCAIHYINIFTDGVIRIWDITNLDHKLPVETNCKKTTCGDTTKVKKMQYLMNKKEVILTAKYE